MAYPNSISLPHLYMVYPLLCVYPSQCVYHSPLELLHLSASTPPLCVYSNSLGMFHLSACNVYSTSLGMFHLYGSTVMGLPHLYGSAYTPPLCVYVYSTSLSLLHLYRSIPHLWVYSSSMVYPTSMIPQLYGSTPPLWPTQTPYVYPTYMVYSLLCVWHCYVSIPTSLRPLHLSGSAPPLWVYSTSMGLPQLYGPKTDNSVISVCGFFQSIVFFYSGNNECIYI